MTTLTTTTPSLTESLTPRPTHPPVWLRVGKLIDGTNRPPLTDAHILYDAKTIHHVSPANLPPPTHLTAGRSEPDLHLPNHTLLPGLIEAHAHLFLDGAPLNFDDRKKYLLQPPEALLQRARTRFHKILLSGVTAIRDAGDKANVGLHLQSDYRLRSDFSAIPYIDSPGAAIHHAGRYGSFMSDPLEQHASPEQCVADRIAKGAARIKIVATGIINFDAGAVTAPPQIPLEELKQITAAARAHHKSTFAHASGTEGIENCIQANVNTVEHGFFITDDQLARMRDGNIAWVPTFAPVQIQVDAAKQLGWSQKIVDGLQKILDRHARSLKHALAIGTPILAGSDAGSCGVPHGLGLLTELELLQAAGMPPLALLTAATSLSAALLTFPEPLGQLTPHHRPRMILTEHDPLQNISNLRHEKYIIFDHHVLHSDGSSNADGL